MAKLVTLVALGVFLLAGNAQAATLTPTGASGPGGTVFGTAPGDPTFSNFAGLLGARVEGEAAWVYCIDIQNRTLLLQPHAEATWAAAGVPNLAKVARILAQHPADATAASGNDVEAAAVQSAIWHFTDDFQLTGGPPGVVTLYNQIVADANANAGSEPAATPTLTLSPDSQTGAGGAYLQFTVSTSAAGPVTLSVTPSGDANVVTCDAAHTPIGGSLAGPFPKQVCLHRTTAGGPVTLAASVSATVPAARVFVLTGSQKLILGSPKSVTVSDSSTATWTQGPPPPPPPVDVCPNIPGDQPTIPPGMIKDANGNCVVPPPPPPPPMSDDCPNLPGVQGSVPEGMIKDANGNCVPRPAPTPPPVDVCPNLAGDQSGVPAGMTKDAAGNCVAIVAAAAPAPTPAAAPVAAPAPPVASTAPKSGVKAKTKTKRVKKKAVKAKKVKSKRKAVKVKKKKAKGAVLPITR